MQPLQFSGAFQHDFVPPDGTYKPTFGDGLGLPSVKKPKSNVDARVRVPRGVGAAAAATVLSQSPEQPVDTKVHAQQALPNIAKAVVSKIEAQMPMGSTTGVPERPAPEFTVPQAGKAVGTGLQTNIYSQRNQMRNEAQERLQNQQRLELLGPRVAGSTNASAGAMTSWSDVVKTTDQTAKEKFPVQDQGSWDDVNWGQVASDTLQAVVMGGAMKAFGGPAPNSPAGLGLAANADANAMATVGRSNTQFQAGWANPFKIKDWLKPRDPRSNAPMAPAAPTNYSNQGASY